MPPIPRIASPWDPEDERHGVGKAIVASYENDTDQVR